MNTVQNLPIISAFWQINWPIYCVALVLVYALGGIWYSPILFGSKWKSLTHPHSKHNFKARLTIAPLAVKFGATALLGLAIFLGVLISLSLTIFFLVTMLAWQKATIFFKHPYLSTFFLVALIELGYFLLAIIVLFVFAMIS